MTSDGFAEVNKYFEELHRVELERLLNGQCRHCGGTFLFGTQADAECVEPQSGDFFYLCFWCAVEPERDPYTGEFEPSQYHYGKC
jgi:hypothetical protein